MEKLDEKTVELVESIPYIINRDKINLILVLLGKKPATTISLSSEFFSKKFGTDVDAEQIFNHIEEMISQLGVPYERTPITDEIENKPYLLIKEEMSKKDRKRRVSVPLKKISIHVGKDQKSLDRLIHAEGDTQIGQAYGYPKGAIESYTPKGLKGAIRHVTDDSVLEIPLNWVKTRIKGSSSDLHQYFNRLKKEFTPDTIPEELAFIPHVPMSSEKKIVDDDSLKMAREYASEIKENDPQLYDKHVKEFKKYIFGVGHG